MKNTHNSHTKEYNSYRAQQISQWDVFAPAQLSAVAGCLTPSWFTEDVLPHIVLQVERRKQQRLVGLRELLEFVEVESGIRIHLVQLRFQPVH